MEIRSPISSQQIQPNRPRSSGHHTNHHAHHLLPHQRKVHRQHDSHRITYPLHSFRYIDGVLERRLEQFHPPGESPDFCLFNYGFVFGGFRGGKEGQKWVARVIGVGASLDTCGSQTIQEEVKLVGAWFSPYVHRVTWVLKLKGIQYEYVEEKINSKSSLLLDCNPVHKKVPVLLHHGKPIAESLFIIEYIDETWKQNPILPTDPYDRAMARFWAPYIDQMILEGSKRALYVEGEQLKKEIKKVSEAMEVLEGMLKGKKYFGGDRLGFLDIAFGWIAIWLEAIDQVAGFRFLDSNKYPLLHKWKNKFREIDVVKDSLFPMEKLVCFFKKYSQYSKLKLSEATK
ncbi:probable glutathione S-transferase [Hibiscus syriacus]|uniref:probable glutathione S-transferase n=1 Tax=Hibiscus syriacus TaxID=106335 RepID=UPI0019224B34|nr:probable glutathione S-transferase [Hibiscus syriacus]